MQEIIKASGKEATTEASNNKTLAGFHRQHSVGTISTTATKHINAVVVNLFYYSR